MPYYRYALLVDDDPIQNFLSRMLLEKHQIAEQVICFSDALSSLDFIQKLFQSDTKESVVDLLLLDIQLPVMNGFALMDQLIQQGLISDHFRIFMLTTSLHQKDRNQALAYPLSDYLVKPLREEDLRKLTEGL
jgi:CheY-like chemotaxis protein